MVSLPGFRDIVSRVLRRTGCRNRTARPNNMKTKTEKTSIRVSIELCVVGLIVIGIVLGACLLVDRYKTRRATTPHDTCAKCQHLFAKGSGKAVVTVHSFRDRLGEHRKTTNTYCQTDAPAYDRVIRAGADDSESGVFAFGQTTFARKQHPWLEVDSNGERLDKPKPCEREHVPSSTNTLWFTNNPTAWRIITH